MLLCVDVYIINVYIVGMLRVHLTCDRKKWCLDSWWVNWLGPFTRGGRTVYTRDMSNHVMTQRQDATEITQITSLTIFTSLTICLLSQQKGETWLIRSGQACAFCWPSTCVAYNVHTSTQIPLTRWSTIGPFHMIWLFLFYLVADPNDWLFTPLTW